MICWNSNIQKLVKMVIWNDLNFPFFELFCDDQKLISLYSYLFSLMKPLSLRVPRRRKTRLGAIFIKEINDQHTFHGGMQALFNHVVCLSMPVLRCYLLSKSKPKPSHAHPTLKKWDAGTKAPVFLNLKRLIALGLLAQ